MAKLNVKKVAKLSKPGRYADGANLYVQITETGRSWVFRYEVRGRERWMGFGPLRDFTLEEAREEAMAARKLLKKGIDPLDARKAERDARAKEAAKQIDFETAARDYFKGHEAKWSNARHRQQVLGSLETFAFPKIGGMSIAAVDTPSVLEALKPIWHERTVTAARVRGRIESALDSGDCFRLSLRPKPSRLEGAPRSDPAEQKPNREAQGSCRDALCRAPAFIAALATRKNVERLAMEFLVWTAARSGEVIGARWSEFDLAAKVWTVPSSRMKMRREHRVPLSDRAVAILKGLPREGDFVFIGAKKGRPIGKMAMAKVLAATGHDGVTVHGMRSAFRDRACRADHSPREIREADAAHRTGREHRDGVPKRMRSLGEVAAKLRKPWSRF